ncbi:MAG: biotin transporter BioY [Armatimonadota bacterium]
MSIATSPSLTLPVFRPMIDVLLPRPSGRLSGLMADSALIITGTLVVAASARVVIPLPFTPVPITGQTFGVLLVGMLLGARRGALSLLLYLLEGALNLPVYQGGNGGIIRLLGPTAGYLWSYPFAAFLMGLLVERGWDRTPLRAAAAMLLGGIVILSMGTLWLGCLTGDLRSAILQGCLPFLPGDIVKTALAATLLPGGWKLIKVKK